MARPTSIHKGKTPFRLHYIPEWAAKYGLEQRDFIENLEVDKGTVSRWFAGRLPAEANLPRIAAYLHCGVDDLFRLPGDDWMKRFFDGRPKAEIEHIKKSMETTFPKKSGTGG